MANNVPRRSSHVPRRARLQKVIAEAGFCSRRKAEDLIRAGEVQVNGRKAVIGQSVTPGDQITINGKPLQGRQTKIYLALNKPVGYTCTSRRFKGEKNIFDLVNVDERLFVVGRLDKNSRGLVILTNDGDYAQKMSHPRFHHEKIYEVTVEPPLSRGESKGGSGRSREAAEIITCLTKGITDEGDFLIAKKAQYLGNDKFRITLTEGKKRQLRRMFGALDLRVTDLVRTQIGNIRLGDLPEGRYQQIKNKN
ncbi:MAG: pseudouridine synthase [Patescibacteria group bacterium]